MIGDILQPTHLLFVLVIALLVLGPKRLPEVGRSLGRGLRDFRSALSGDEQDRHDPTLPEGNAADMPQPAVPVVQPAQNAVQPAQHVVNAEQPAPAQSVATAAEPEQQAAERVS